MAKIPYMPREAFLFGTRGAAITPSNDDLPRDTKTVVCLSDGDVTIVPTGNSDSETLTFTGCAVGFMPPYRVRRVVAATGEWATVLG